MNIPFVDLKAQYASIKDEMDAAIQDVLHNTAFIGGEHLKRFESKFADYCDADHCVGVGNGTDALWIALKMLGIGPRDEVIVPANSFVATSEAVTLTGAEVVFCDIDRDRYTISPPLIAEKITQRTKAIIAVHLYGCPADMAPINEIAREHGLFVVEDAAQAHGAVYKGRKIGSLGDVGCFSFYPGKNLGAYGDAGAVVTNNEELATKVRMFANHGRIGKYNHEFEGANSRLDGLQAAVLNVKLDHIDAWSKARLTNAKKYNNMFAEIEEIDTPIIPDDSTAVFHLYVIRIDERDELRAFLKEKNISAGVHYPIALPNLDAYRYLGHKPDDFPVSSEYQERILSLPMFPELTHAMIDKVFDKCLEGLSY